MQWELQSIILSQSTCAHHSPHSNHQADREMHKGKLGLIRHDSCVQQARREHLRQCLTIQSGGLCCAACWGARRCPAGAALHCIPCLESSPPAVWAASPPAGRAPGCAGGWGPGAPLPPPMPPHPPLPGCPSTLHHRQQNGITPHVLMHHSVVQMCMSTMM